MPSASEKLQTDQMNSQIPQQTELVDGLKQAITALEKRLRNLEKRKTKLDLYRTKEKEGQNLDKDQKQAILKYEEVCSAVDFAKEFQKQLSLINQECDRVVKRQQKKEKQDRIQQDNKRVQDLLSLQEVLNALGNEDTRADFQSGNHGAVVLTEQNLEHLDQLYKLVSPTREDDGDYRTNLINSAEHINNLIDARPWPVLATTYKDLNDLLKLISNCGYFENVDRFKNDSAIAGPLSTDPHLEVLDSQSVGAENACLTTEILADTTENCSITTPSLLTSSPGIPAINETNTDAFFSPVETFQSAATVFQSQVYQEPKRPFHDILSSVKGTFDFLQDSTIDDTDGVPVDPAIVSIHPPMMHQTPPLLFSKESLTTQQPPDVSEQPVDPNIISVTSDQRMRQQSESQKDYAVYQNFSPSFSSGVKPGYDELNVYRGNGDESAASTGVVHDLTDTSGPPPIPLPNQSHQASAADKKFVLNSNAAVFTSMYESSHLDRDIAASSHTSEQESEYTGAGNRQTAASQSANSYRVNQGVNRDNSSGGHSRGAGANASNHQQKKKTVYKGYPPRADYKPIAYQGYNDSGFNLHYRRPQGGREGGNSPRGGSSQRGTPSTGTLQANQQQ